MLHESYRRSPFQCNILMGGYDAPPNGKGASLYSCDYLGTLVKLKFAAEGYAQYFVLSTLDRYWKKNLSVDEGLDIIKKCVAEIQKRLVISQPRFSIKMVSKDGVTILDAADSTTPGKKGDVMVTEAPIQTAPVQKASA
ncbi:proteasome chain protein [Gracilaria domingensis]|nr:proteasome chain protein [Gracilaria domingensis]